MLIRLTEIWSRYYHKPTSLTYEYFYAFIGCMEHPLLSGWVPMSPTLSHWQYQDGWLVGWFGRSVGRLVFDGTSAQTCYIVPWSMSYIM